MNTRKTFSLTNAIKFALNNIVENIGTILFLAAFALGLWALFTVITIATLSQFTDLALVKAYFYNITFSRSFMAMPPEGLKTGILFAISFIQTIAGLFTINQMTLRFALGISNKKPLSISELLSFDIKKITSYIGALLLAFVKIMFASFPLIILASLIVGYFFPGLFVGAEGFYAINPIIRYAIFLFFILLYSPGLYYAGRYFFAGYSIIDGTTQTITEDTKNITNITQGVKLRLLGTYALFSLAPLVILKVLTGTILPNALLIPVATLIYVHIYEQLKAAEASTDSSLST